MRRPDIPFADASAVTLAEHVPEGAPMLPAEFRIADDPGAATSALEATVHHRGRLLDINDTVHPVLTDENPAQRDIEAVPVR